jgi:hypothetical protein
MISQNVSSHIQLFRSTGYRSQSLVPPVSLLLLLLLLLLRLPTELFLIFHLADRLDKACIALSCQYFLQISALASLKVPLQPKHRPQSSYQKIEELFKHVKPIDAHGKPKIIHPGNRKCTTLGLCRGNPLIGGTLNSLTTSSICSLAVI